MYSVSNRPICDYSPFFFSELNGYKLLNRILGKRTSWSVGGDVSILHGCCLTPPINVGDRRGFGPGDNLMPHLMILSFPCRYVMRAMYRVRSAYLVAR